MFEVLVFMFENYIAQHALPGDLNAARALVQRGG